MTKSTLSACALLAALSSVQPSNAAEEALGKKELLTYEIVITDPGTRSQGWHGTLYDESGHIKPVEIGKIENTEIGELVSVAPTEEQPWTPYGMIPTTPGMENVVAPDPWASVTWSFELYRTNIGSKCPSWRGELLRGGVAVEPQTAGEQIQTPLGPFIWLDAQKPHGWVHKSWKVKKVNENARCG